MYVFVCVGMRVYVCVDLAMNKEESAYLTRQIYNAFDQMCYCIKEKL